MTIESNDSKGIEIGFLKAGDADALFELRLSARKTEPHIFTTSYETERGMSREEKMKRVQEAQGEGSSRIYVLAKHSAVPVGMMGASDIGAGVWDLHGVYVVPQFRGMHIAEDMLRMIVKKLRSRHGARKMRFEVETENTPAVHLYKKFGFEVVGTSKQRMGDGKEYEKSILEQDLDRIQC